MKGNAHRVTPMSNTRYLTLVVFKVWKRIDKQLFSYNTEVRYTHAEWKIMNY